MATFHLQFPQRLGPKLISLQPFLQIYKLCKNLNKAFYIYPSLNSVLLTNAVQRACVGGNLVFDQL